VHQLDIKVLNVVKNMLFYSDNKFCVRIFHGQANAQNPTYLRVVAIYKILI